jgi:hypothetical protein
MKVGYYLKSELVTGCQLPDFVAFEMDVFSINNLPGRA